MGTRLGMVAPMVLRSVTTTEMATRSSSASRGLDHAQTVTSVEERFLVCWNDLKSEPSAKMIVLLRERRCDVRRNVNELK
jgi:hypothetical protein